MIKKRAVLIGPQFESLSDQRLALNRAQIRGNDLIIGVDGGVQVALRLGLKLDLAIGDWDSFQGSERTLNRLLSKIPHVTLSREKDQSDLLSAAIAAIEMGARELACIGVSGGRSDHQVAMLLDLSILSSGKYGKLSKVQVLGKDADYAFLSSFISEWEVQVTPGTLFSVFSLSEKVEGLILKGFKYPVHNLTLRPSSLGLSNVAKKRKVHVSLRKGRVVIIMPHGNE